MSELNKGGRDAIRKLHERGWLKYDSIHKYLPELLDAADLLDQAVKFEVHHEPNKFDSIYVAKVRQQDDSYLWAIRSEGDSSCFTKEGEWEFEPTPSCRDDEYLARARYATREEAFEAVPRAVARRKELYGR